MHEVLFLADPDDQIHVVVIGDTVGMLFPASGADIDELLAFFTVSFHGDRLHEAFAGAFAVPGSCFVNVL